MTKFLLPEENVQKRRKAKKKSKLPQPKYFVAENPHKYVGDANCIIARSNLERKFYKIFDTNPAVLKWGCEEMYIRYKSSVDGTLHRYFPDAVIEIKTRSGKKMIYMIEIKPKKQCFPPKSSKSKRFLNEQITYQINQDKWKAATEFCKSHGMVFHVLTEEHVGGF